MHQNTVDLFRASGKKMSPKNLMDTEIVYKDQERLTKHYLHPLHQLKLPRFYCVKLYYCTCISLPRIIFMMGFVETYLQYF